MFNEDYEEDGTTEAEFVTTLMTALEDYEPEYTGVESTVSFENSGMLTINKGLVVRLANGSEFHLTVVKSR